MPKREPEVRQSTAKRMLGPGEESRDALDWLERELSEIDRLISEALEKLADNNSS